MSVPQKVTTAAEAGVMVGIPPAPAGRVTLENWLVHPFSRWSLLHTREVISTTSVDPAPGLVTGLPVAPADLEGVEVALGQERMTISSYVDRSWIDGFLVLQDGRIRIETYRNGMTPATRHLVMSVSKSITSLIVGVLVERGLVGLDDEVTRIVPELDGTAYEGATVQHLLDMRVACDWLEDYESETSEFWRLDVACGWAPARDETPDTLLGLMRRFTGNGRHGQVMQYLSPNADLLGLIAERVTRTRLPELVSDELWQPCGMEWSADLARDPVGMSVTDGGFCITLRDLGRLGQLVLDDGRVGSRQVVPRSWLAECWLAQETSFVPRSFGADVPGATYHNLWWQMDGRLFALGIRGQMLAVDPAAGLVIAFLSSSPGPVDELQAQRVVVGALADACESRGR
jgi:CubicO group peptidase (beta-lactamase class C family)